MKLSYYRVFRATECNYGDVREVQSAGNLARRDKSAELGRDEFMTVITMTDYVQMTSPVLCIKEEMLRWRYFPGWISGYNNGASL